MASKPLDWSPKYGGAARCLNCGRFAGEDHECSGEQLGKCDHCGQTLPTNPDDHECPDLSDEGEIPACPNEDCQSTAIVTQPTNRRWYCPRCKTYCDEPEWRVRKNVSAGLNGSQQILWDADPSEYP